MEVVEVDHKEYGRLIKPYHIFGSSAFAGLNAHKVPSVHYLLFKDTKVRLGIIGGVAEETFSSPFSAPFDGFSPTDPDVGLRALEDSVAALEQWSADRRLTRLLITPPPPVYAESFLAKMGNVFYRRGYAIRNNELNFHFELDRLSEDYPARIWRNARKNLRQAQENGLTFSRCESDAEQRTAYEIIGINRNTRGKPFRMTYEQLIQTAAVIPIEYFLVRTPDNLPVGAAIVFEVAEGIGQVVYWGDLPDFAQLRTMNFLSFKVFEYYKKKGLRILDIGYSTEDSVPNHGLCEFKESLGCSMQPKLIYEKRF